MVSVEPWPVVPPRCSLGPPAQGRHAGQSPSLRAGTVGTRWGWGGMQVPLGAGPGGPWASHEAFPPPGEDLARPVAGAECRRLQNPRAPTHLATPTSGSRSGPGPHGTSDPRRFALRPLRPGRAGHSLNPRTRALSISQATSSLTPGPSHMPHPLPGWGSAHLAGPPGLAPAWQPVASLARPSSEQVQLLGPTRQCRPGLGGVRHAPRGLGPNHMKS